MTEQRHSQLSTEETLRKLLRARIVIIDGAMGTMIQQYKREESAYRGERFAAWKKVLKGNSDLLNVTRADILLVETIFDTLNSKAAFFAIEKLFDKIDYRLPLMASVTFIQAGSNRGVTGQTVEGFWNSISHVPLLSVGMNCALGPKEMRPLIEELSSLAPIYVSAYPNAGLPNPLLPTGFPETPETLAPQLRDWAENGWLNFVGGCCGTTPPHIKAIAEAVKALPPRVPPKGEPYLR